MADVQRKFGKLEKENLPLHCKKDVQPMDLVALLGLDNKTPECRSFVTTAFEWLNNANKYNNIELKPKMARFSQKHFDQMLGYKYKALYGLPEGFVEGFLRVESSKDTKHPYRLRPLFAPDANEQTATREMLQKLVMSKKESIRLNGAGNPELVVQLDMKSYYDQFPLSEGVKKKMCFLGDDGKVYALERLPMGLRPACEVAQAVTWFLLDFEMDPRVKVNTCIDNIRFTGPKNETTDAIRTFLTRCKIVGAQLDKNPELTDEGITALDERKGDFLGEHYDYVNGTRALTPKTVDKLLVVDKWLKQQVEEGDITLTASQFSTLMGLLFWTKQVLDLELASCFHLLRDYRNSCSEAVSGGYGTYTKLTATAKGELKKWLETAIENKAVPMVPPTRDRPTLNIVVDASGVGFGAIATTDFTDCKMISGAWPEEMLEKAQSSVWAEPEGIFMACCRFVRPTDTHVRIYTDHSPVVYAAAAGYAKGFSPNLLLKRLRDTFKGVYFEIVHVKGVNNPADRFSRLGEDMRGGKEELTEGEWDLVKRLEAERWELGPKDNVDPLYLADKDNKPQFMV